MTKAERIRRTAKRTKPDAVELLRREMELLSDHRKQALAMSATKRDGSCAAATYEGMAIAYGIVADRLQRKLEQLTEYAT